MTVATSVICGTAAIDEADSMLSTSSESSTRINIVTLIVLFTPVLSGVLLVLRSTYVGTNLLVFLAYSFGGTVGRQNNWIVSIVFISVVQHTLASGRVLLFGTLANGKIASTFNLAMDAEIDESGVVVKVILGSKSTVALTSDYVASCLARCYWATTFSWVFENALTCLSSNDELINFVDDEDVDACLTLNCLVSLIRPATLTSSLQIVGEGSRFMPEFVGKTIAASERIPATTKHDRRCG
jgi:hypothetical protein